MSAVALVRPHDSLTAPAGVATPDAAASTTSCSSDIPSNEAWFPAFAEGFRLWIGDGDARDPDRAVPLLCDAARLGHGGSALLLSNVFEELAEEADARHDHREARTYTRLSIVYKTAAFWSSADDPAVELDHECKADWDVARVAPPEPRLWDAIDALSEDPLAAMRGFEALAAQDHPVHGGFLASVAAEQAAECSDDPHVAAGFLERARASLLRSAAAGNRAAQKRLFIARAGQRRA